MADKQLPQSTFLGHVGTNRVERIVTDMGFLWNPSRMDAGIDGYIEIRDPLTAVATNCVILVQCKATEVDFRAETAAGFDFYCDPSDLKYWLAGNAPVLLVVCRPSTDEAYWISIKDYFRDPELKKDHKVHFDKNKDRFSKESADALKSIGIPRDSGIYFSPGKKEEVLYSNLLPVTKLPERVYVASTTKFKRSAVFAQFKAKKVNPKSYTGEFLLHRKQFISVHNLKWEPWTTVCDAGTMESFEFAEWANAGDADKRRLIVQLLNLCLSEMAWRIGFRYNKRDDCYFYRGNEQLKKRRVKAAALTRDTHKTLFQVYYGKKNPERVVGCRHTAFRAKFQLYDGCWYLEVTPTYFYTSDGRRRKRNSHQLRQGIKLIEKQKAVFAQVLAISDLLSRRRADLFTQEYAYLGLGPVAQFKIGVGIDDGAWKIAAGEADDEGEAESFLRLNL
jgi:hypothetical protein